MRGWARAHLGIVFPSARTAVLGASAGGELALALGLRHPDVFGVVFCASPGADIVMHERDAGHDDAMWRAELPRMLAWAFGQ